MRFALLSLLVAAFLSGPSSSIFAFDDRRYETDFDILLPAPAPKVDPEKLPPHDAFGTAISTADKEAPLALSLEEECFVSFFTTINIMLSGISPDADDQMQRLAVDFQLEVHDPAYLATMLECGNLATLPPNRQNIVVELAKCRYRDLVVDEYERDNVPVPAVWAEICNLHAIP